MKLSLLNVSFLILSLFHPSQTWAGGGSTGGGDPLAQEFVKSGWDAYYALVIGVPMPGNPIDADKFQDFLKTTEVETTKKQVLFKGMDKCAKYDADLKHIMVNRKCFKHLDPRKRRDLALHEYLRAMDIPDNNYQVSGKLSAFFDSRDKMYSSEANTPPPSKAVNDDASLSNNLTSNLRKLYAPLIGKFSGILTSPTGSAQPVLLELTPITVVNLNSAGSEQTALPSLAGTLIGAFQNPYYTGSYYSGYSGGYGYGYGSPYGYNPYAPGLPNGTNGLCSAGYSQMNSICVATSTLAQFNSAIFDEKTRKLTLSFSQTQSGSYSYGIPQIFIEAWFNEDLSQLQGRVYSSLNPNVGTFMLERTR